MIEDLVVRDALDSDVPELRQLYASSVRSAGVEAYPPEAVAAWSSFSEAPEFEGFVLRNRTIVVEDDTGLVGFGGADPSGRIASLYVRGDRLHEGIGTKILERLLARLLSEGVRRVWTEASELSRPLFERFGFVTVAEESVIRSGVPIRRCRMEADLPTAAAEAPVAPPQVRPGPGLAG